MPSETSINQNTESFAGSFVGYQEDEMALLDTNDDSVDLV
jgi:hypothetical protein